MNSKYFFIFLITLQLQDDSIDAAMFYPRVLSIYGNWLAETRSENPNVIMEDYLEKVDCLVFIIIR